MPIILAADLLLHTVLQIP